MPFIPWKQCHSISIKAKAPPPAAVAAEDQHQEPKFPKDPILRKPSRDVNEDYKISAELGRGRFGITYICKEKSTGKKYACKSISKKRLDTEIEKEGVRKEVRIMEDLKGQPNVVELIKTYEDDDHVHLIMEYCEGGELLAKMKSKGRFSEKIAAQILSSIMKVVACLDFMGVMHRDLKPENFLLPKRSALGFIPCMVDYTLLKAIDFGSSTFFIEGEAKHRKVGTAFYVAPEVLQARGYGKEIDIWSAGVILYMLLAGAPPFYGENEPQIFEAIRGGKIDMESHPWPSISQNAKNLVKKMLSMDPKDRPHAVDVLNDPWLEENGVRTGNPIDDLAARMKHFEAMNKFKKVAVKAIMDILPPEEFEGLKAMFRNIDTDKSKFISHEELQKTLVRHGSSLGPEHVKLIFDAADADRDGLLNYEEFATAMVNIPKLCKEEYLRKAFEQYAENKEFISKKELKSAMERCNMGDDAIIEEIIKDIDVNKDGQISYEEFCAMVRG